jgi:MSHA biogenesis protein MshQ
VVKSSGAALDTYFVIPEVTTYIPPPFNAYETGTGAGAITGAITTKRAGSTISLHIIALNAPKTAIETTFTGAVKVDVLNASDNSGALDTATGCRSSWTVIQTLSPDPVFTDGRDPISFTVANAYPNVRIRVRYPAAAPTVTGCSTDNFAIRPDTLGSFAITDTDWQTAGTSRALTDVTFGTVTHKAGRPLSVRATAVNTSAATTTNYAGTATVVPSVCAGAACTSIAGMSGSIAFVAGQYATDVASYTNVGSFAVRLEDQNFASVDAGDTPGDCSSTGRYVCSATINVGRFVPDHYAVSLNAPSLAAACSGGGFTYVGQTFNFTTAPVITVTAQDFANNTTTLYAGAWARITNTSLSPAAYDTQGERYLRFDALGGGATPALNTAGLPAVTADPAISAFTNGVGTLTFGSGSGLSFTRNTPAAPFNADISLALNVIDADNVVYSSNPVSFGTASLNGGIAFSGGKDMRFGRLAIRNASGSQLLPLLVPMETQYWNGSSFITNIADNCTTVTAANIGLGNYSGNLGSGETTPTVAAGAFSGGRKTLLLSAPGAANNGSADIVVNLGTTTTIDSCLTWGTTPTPTGGNLTHLDGLWCGASYSKDPTARATFGVYRGAEEVIHIRENF